MLDKHQITQATFDELVRCALAGERCPVTAREGTDGLSSEAVRNLARSGHILIEIYPRNFRRITILKGPHAGKSTRPPNNRAWRPYIVIDATGSKRNYRNKRSAPTAPVAAPRPTPGPPSAPRALTMSELSKL